MLVGPPVPPQYSNYDEQHYDEILAILNEIDGADTPIVMGELYQGPASPRDNIAPIFPFHHGLMSAAGFVSPYVLHDGRCTFCADNPVVGSHTNLLTGMLEHEHLKGGTYQGELDTCEVTVS